MEGLIEGLQQLSKRSETDPSRYHIEFALSPKP